LPLRIPPVGLTQTYKLAFTAVANLFLGVKFNEIGNLNFCSW